MDLGGGFFSRRLVSLVCNMLSEQDSVEAGGASERSRERDAEHEKDRNSPKGKGTSSQAQTKCT